MTMRWMRATIGAVGVASLLLLAGCGGSGEVREAGASSLPSGASASSVPSAEAMPEASGEAQPAGAGAVKSVRWCFTNDATAPVTIFFGSAMYPADYQITGGASGNGGPVALEPKQEACSSHGFLISVDATATITFANGRETTFAVYNPLIGYPQYVSNWVGSMTRGDWHAFSVGETRDYDRHYNTWTVTREPDSEFKEFRIRFTGESAPAGASASASAAAVAAEAPDGIGRKGVNVCFTNDTDRKVRLDWFQADTNQGNAMAPGAKVCGEGTYQFSVADVIVGVKYDDNLSTTLSFNNQTIGYPTVTQDPGQASAAEACGTGDFSIGDWGGLGFSYDCFDAYGVGDTQTYVVDKYHGMVITRLPDDAWKQFAVSIRR